MKKNLFLISIMLTAVVIVNAQLRGIESITSNNVSIIKFGAAGKVWASTPGNGCAVYDTSARAWTNFDPFTTPIMTSDSITAIDLYPINTVATSFMASTNGVYYRQNTTWDTLAGLPDSYITGIIKSPDGNLFVSSPTGISVYNANALNHITDYNTSNSSLPYNNISALQFKEINSPGFYAATPDSGYFYTSDGITYHSINTSNSGLIDNRINCILISADTTHHYIGTKGGLSIYSSGTFANFTTVQGLPENDVTAVEVDCQGDIWIGTRNSGIAIYNGSTFTYLNQSNLLPSNKINTINCNTNCQCWIGTQDSGIVVIDSAGMVQESFTGLKEEGSAKQFVKIFPQPADELLHITLDNIHVGAEFIVYDISGKSILTRNIANETDFTVDVNRLSAGLYFYAIKKSGAILNTGKISVAR